MSEVFQFIYRLSSSMFLCLEGLMKMLPLPNIDLASASTAKGPWFSDRPTHTCQNPPGRHTGVAHSGWAPPSRDTPANSTDQKASREFISTSTTGPMPAIAQSVADPPSKNPQPPASSPQARINNGSLRTGRFVVMGEGLAAGMGNFTLSSDSQRWSFATQMARQMGAQCPQRLIQAPGIGNLIGFPPLPVRVPAPSQSTVIDQLPPAALSNLAVPSLTLDDALNLRAVQPLIHRSDAKQSAINLIWGLVPISNGEESAPTQLQYALQQSPTFTVVELGYHEMLEAAVLGDPSRLPNAEIFISQYRDLLQQLKRSGSQILVTTIPDPIDTAYFSSVSTAARLLKIDAVSLTKLYSIQTTDLITVNGINEISFQLFSRLVQPLPANSLLAADAARKISNRVREINARLSDLALPFGTLYDLAGLFHKVATEGYLVNTRRLMAEFLGGFYSLNGYYPGATGQAIIANEILDVLNHSYGSSFTMIDISAVMAADSTAACRQAAGPAWSARDVEQIPVQSRTPSRDNSPASAAAKYRAQKKVDNSWTPLVPEEPKLPLELPPRLEQVLPLSKTASYFGDGIGALDCHDPIGIQWGCGSPIFGGLAMVDSHLSGSLRIKFTEPVNNVSHFEISFEDGFQGEDSVLAAPQFFKMPFQQNRVDQVPDTISSGNLNLETGDVSDLTVYARYSSTALTALVSVNPTFPKQPLSFPGQYGYAWARFEQRADGKLDFTFYGSTFVPLGKDISWPLNFVGPSGNFATVPAAGTVMHPHLQLSTRAPEDGESEDVSADIPFNTLQEYTLLTHNSAFGDLFTFNSPEVGGRAKGRSHLLGRLQIQFGPRAGSSVPIAVWSLPPGALMAPMPESPITQVFPAPLSQGPQGFDERSRYPLKTYPMTSLSIVDDPFDISVGAIHLETGRMINDLPHRGFINQTVIYALLRIEPRTPKDSFYFRGPALVTKDKRNQMVFRFRGITHLPYPEGYLFPRPDLVTGFPAGPGAYLDPFLWFHAIQSDASPDVVMEGEVQHVRATSGDDFSYRYRIPSDPINKQVIFEYENHSQQGKFRMHSLAWLDFSNSGATPSSREPYDTVTFSGYGIWTKDDIWSNVTTNTLLQASVQITTAPAKPYTGISIAYNVVSNVHIKPENEVDALP